MNIVVWIAQSFLAVFFFAVGVPKVAGRGMERWVGFDALPRPLVVLIGVAEVAAGIALVVPMAIGVGAWSTPLAALGVAVISLMASGFHLRAEERLPALETALWSALAAAVAIARWDELSSAASVPDGVLMAALPILMVAIVTNLVVLFGRPAAPVVTDEPALTPQPTAPR